MNIRKPSFVAIGLFVGLLQASANAAIQQRYYVTTASSGCDDTLGTEAVPFCTLTAARNAVRYFLAHNTLTGDIVVYLRGGIYEIDGPLDLGPEDSGQVTGTGTHYVIYTSYPGELAMLSAGKRLPPGGWAGPASDGTFSISLPNISDFRQLYVNGRRAVRARHPNAGIYYYLPTTQDITITNHTGGINLPAGSLSGIPFIEDSIEISIPIEWMHKRLRITSLSSNPDGTVKANINMAEWSGVVNGKQGNQDYSGRQYWLENAKQFLDAPGEFYWDQANHVLYYKPWPEQDMATAEVVVPIHESIFKLNGSLGSSPANTNPVSHIKIQNLVLAHTNWTRPNLYGFVDVQANSLMPPGDEAGTWPVDTQYRHNFRKDRVPGAIHASTADDIVISGNRFARLGGTAILFTMGGDSNLIAENSIIDVAGGGIEIGNDANAPLNTRMFPSNNKITNNFISRIGLDYFGSVGILGYYTIAQEVSNNELSCLPYSGISHGWGWGTPSSGLIGNNVIKNNTVRAYGNRVRDGGGIYLTGPENASTIHHNYLTEQNKTINAQNGGAIFPDEASAGFTFDSNVIDSAPRWLYIWARSVHDIKISNSYVDTLQSVNNGVDITIKDTAGPSWDSVQRAAVNTIISAAGLSSAARTPRPDVPADIVVDDADPCFSARSGQWLIGGLSGNYGGGYVYAATKSSAPATATARWRPILPTDGQYVVSAWTAPGTDRATGAVYEIYTNSTPVLSAPVDQSKTRQWFDLGSYAFTAGAKSYVDLSNVSGGGTYIEADALRFRGEVIVDNESYRAGAVFGDWVTSSTLSAKYGDNYRYAPGSTAATATAAFRWTPLLTAAGNYRVHAFSAADPGRATRANYTVFSPLQAQRTVPIDQRNNGSKWSLVTCMYFPAGTGSYVQLSNENSDGVIEADAVKFEPVAVCP